MTYTAQKPKLVPDSSELRSRVPGWGADLDPAVRPAVPKERFDPGATGAHWDFPERQAERYPRERSTEHKFLTPVFGTSCPPRGLSGLVRRFAYTFSEGRSAHWLLLMLGDRIDVVESSVLDLLRGRPDNFLAEFGLRAEVRRLGLRSRFGQGRTDLRHLPLDVAGVVVRGALAVAAVYYVGRGVLAAGRAVAVAAGGRRGRHRGGGLLRALSPG